MDKQYVTVEEVSKYLLLDIVDSFQDQVDNWIIAMSNQVALMTNREWLAGSAEYPETRYFDGKGNAYLRIGEAIDIDAVYVGEDYGENFVAITDYITYPYSGNLITKLIRKDNAFDRGIKNIKVVGRFGYGETVPEDIKFAVVVMVAGLIMNQTNQDGEIESEKIGNYAVTYKTDEQKNDFNTAKNIIASRRVILL
jgi:hypothetical protein